MSHVRNVCPVHLIFLKFIIRIIFDDEYEFWRPSLCGFLPPVTSFLLGANIFVRVSYSNALNLSSSLRMRDLVSYPLVLYKLPWISVHLEKNTVSRNTGHQFLSWKYLEPCTAPRSPWKINATNEKSNREYKEGSSARRRNKCTGECMSTMNWEGRM
jgi:hypothetical protein